MPIHFFDSLLWGHHEGHDCEVHGHGNAVLLASSKHVVQGSDHSGSSDFLTSTWTPLPGPRTRRISATQAASFLEGPSGASAPLRSAHGMRNTALATGGHSSSHGLGEMFLMSPGAAKAAQRAAMATSFLSLQQKMTELVQATPPAALVPLHAASIVFSVPGHLAFELAEGFLFGFQRGFVLAFVGKSLGAVTAFAVGRMALSVGGLKDSLQSKLESWPAARDVAVAVERQGAFSVFLIRIAPVPCTVKNYALAMLTKVPFATFVPFTLLGLVPTTAAHVYAGTLAPSAADLLSGHGSVMQFVATAGVVTTMGMMSLLAGYYLKEQMNTDTSEEDDADIEVKLKASNLQIK